MILQMVLINKQNWNPYWNNIAQGLGSQIRGCNGMEPNGFLVDRVMDYRVNTGTK
jgi:hypothetical protein